MCGCTVPGRPGQLHHGHLARCLRPAYAMSKMERRDDGGGGARTCEYSGLERGEQKQGSWDKWLAW